MPHYLIIVKRFEDDEPERARDFFDEATADDEPPIAAILTMDLGIGNHPGDILQHFAGQPLEDVLAEAAGFYIRRPR
ncbi:MAG: hypothetical protein R3C15_07515 [Thermoleophilia bacterium]